MTETKLFADHALLPDGWARNVLFDIAKDGNLVAVTADADPGTAQSCKGPVLPGMPNLHSHAFQRAMAGLAERAGPGDDSFWTWREVMYGFVGRLTPEQVRVIAAQLYVEMLKRGYTAVGEFHYLHHDPDGQPYADLTEMSRQTIAAAQATGIGITQLPVLYGYGNFGGQAAGAGQRRFINDPQRFLKLVESLLRDHRDDPQIRIGMAPHSLRAVTKESLRESLGALDTLDPTAPVHIHIAEQQQEVHDCLEWCGQRPVEWLLQNLQPDARWCLIHATHMTEGETAELARSGAVAGLCPTTEANLGDGLFPAVDYLRQNGIFGIGSDSHISVSPIEELRWLEYGQRLAYQRRNMLAGGEARPSVGAALYHKVLAGGAQALGRPIGKLVPGCRADLIVLDADCPALFGKNGNHLLDAMIFAGNANPVRDTMVGGDWVVRDGRHKEEQAVFAAYKDAVAALTE